MLNVEEWERLVVPAHRFDVMCVQVAAQSIPRDWMLRTPDSIVSGGALLACRYERRAIAESIRSNTLLSDRGGEIKEIMDRLPDLSRLVGRFDEQFLDLAQVIEDGAIISW